MQRFVGLLLLVGCNTDHEAASTPIDSSVDIDALFYEDAPLDAFIADPRPSSMRMTKRPVGTTDSTSGFWEYLPPNYNPNAAPIPVLVALHGLGEDGDGSSTGLDTLGNVAIQSLIRHDQWPNTRPFIVLSPQHPGGGCFGAAEIHDFITFATTHYHVDSNNVFLTGLSCGAIGAWAYLDAYLDQQIAAQVTIAGDGRAAWADRHCDLGKVAIWDFHGDADPTVNITGSNVPMTGLAACPAPPRKDAQYTVYPGVGHDSWDMTYNLSAGHDIYAWLLAHHK